METDPIQDPTGPRYIMSEPKLKGTLPDDAKSISDETIRNLFKIPEDMKEWKDAEEGPKLRAKYWWQVRQERTNNRQSYKHIYDGYYMDKGVRKDITKDYPYYPFLSPDLSEEAEKAEIEFFKERLFTLMELHFGPNWKVEPRGELRNQLQNIVDALKSNKRVYAREYSACDTRLNRFEPFERKIEFKTIDKPPLTINISEKSFNDALDSKKDVDLTAIIKIQEFGYKSEMEGKPEHFHDPRVQLRHDHNRIIVKLHEKIQYLREQDYNNTREVAEKVQYQIREGLRRCLNGGDYAYQNEYWNMGMFNELGEKLDDLLQGDVDAWKPILKKFVPKRSYKLYEEWKIFCTETKRAYDKKVRTHYMKNWRLRGELQTIPEMKDGREVDQEESSDGSYSGESYTRSAKLPRYDDILSAAIAGMQVSKSIVMSREPLIDLANAFKKFKSTGTLEQGLSALGRFISAVNADEYKDELKEMLESWLTKPDDVEYTGPLGLLAEDNLLRDEIKDSEADHVEVAREFYNFIKVMETIKARGVGDIVFLRKSLNKLNRMKKSYFKSEINKRIAEIEGMIKEAEAARKAAEEAAQEAKKEAEARRAEEERLAKEDAARRAEEERIRAEQEQKDREKRARKAEIKENFQGAVKKVIATERVKKLLKEIEQRNLKTTGNARTIEDKIVISGDFVLHSDEVYKAESAYRNFVTDLDTCTDVDVLAYLNELTPYRKGLDFEYDVAKEEIFLKTTGTRVKYSNPKNVLNTDYILIQRKKGESLLKHLSDKSVPNVIHLPKTLKPSLLASFRENAEKALTAMSKVGKTKKKKNDQRRYIHRDIKPDNISIKLNEEGTKLTEFALFDYDVVVQVDNGIPQVDVDNLFRQGNGKALMDLPMTREQRDALKPNRENFKENLLSQLLDRYQMGIVLLQLGRKFNFAGDDNYELPDNQTLEWGDYSRDIRNFFGEYKAAKGSEYFWKKGQHDKFIDYGRDKDGAKDFAKQLNLSPDHVQAVFTNFLKKEDELSKNATASDGSTQLKQDLTPSAFVKMQSKPSFMVDSAPERRQAVFEEVAVEYDDFSDAELQELMDLSSGDESYEKMSDAQFESLLEEARSRASSARSTPLNAGYNSKSSSARSTPINTGYNSKSSSAHSSPISSNRSSPMNAAYNSKSSSAHSSPISSNRSTPINTGYDSKSSSAHSSPISSNRSSPMNAAYSSKSSSAHSSPINSNRSTPINNIDFDAYNASSTDSNRSTPIGSNASSPISSNRSTPIGKIDFDAYNASSTDSNRSTPIGSNASSPINSNRSTPLNFSSSESDGGSYNNTSGGSDMEY